MVLLAKSKLNRIEVLIPKALIDSVISHEEFILINIVLKQYNKMKAEIKKRLKDLVRSSDLTRVAKVSYCEPFDRTQKCMEDFSQFIKQCYHFVWSAEKIRKVSTKNGIIMLLSECAKSDSKKLKFIKQQEASGVLSSLGIKTSLSKLPLMGPLLF